MTIWRTRERDGCARSRLEISPPIALLILIAAGFVACTPEPMSKEARTRDTPNVVLIVLDTLRADRLGIDEGGTSLTPVLDEFAEEATVFDHAYAHAPWTLPSVASLMTSQTPDRHGAGSTKGRFTQLSLDSETLAETFANAQFTTGAITNVLFLGPRFGAMRGFEFLDHVSTKGNRLLRTAEVTSDVALDWIDRHQSEEEPFFLFLHYFDAHLTYDPPAPFRERHAAPEDRDGRRHVFGEVSEIVAFRRGEITMESDLVRRLERLYRGEVAYMDDALGVLFEGLRERGLFEKSIIVVTADHGEEFQDHGGFEHGHSLFDELLHVPLIVRVPKAMGDQGEAKSPVGRSNATVRIIDVGPTLLELAAIEAPASFTGESLVPQMMGNAGDDRAVLSLGNMWGPSGRAIRRGRFKLIESADGEILGLFDRASDPGERVDVSADHPEIVKELRAELSKRLGDKQSAQRPEAKPAALGERERSELRALGYGE